MGSGDHPAVAFVVGPSLPSLIHPPVAPPGEGGRARGGGGGRRPRRSSPSMLPPAARPAGPGPAVGSFGEHILARRVLGKAGRAPAGVVHAPGRTVPAGVPGPP